MNNTMTEKITLLSKKGMKELKKSISQLEHDRQKALYSLRNKDKDNDRDEKLARIDLIFRLEGIEAEIADKKLILSTARLAPTKRERMRVAIGSIVDLVDYQGRLFRYKIVDSVEANPSDGRISYLSPLGKSLINKTIRDIIEWGNDIRYHSLQLIRIN